MSRGRLFFASAVLGTSFWSAAACRSLSVCEEPTDCAPPARAGASGATTRPQGGDAPNPEAGSGPRGGSGAGGDAGAGTDGGSAGSGGSDGASGAGGDGVVAGAGGESGGSSSCAEGTDECDGSTLTVCETPTDWAVRHCGGCGEACDGVCVVARCKPAEVIQDERAARQFVANSGFAYAMFDGEGAQNIIEIELETGKSRVVGTGFDSETTLALSGDRLYAFTSFELASRDLGSGAFQTEAITARAIAASADGLYYTQASYDPSTKRTTYSLWRRPTGALASALVTEGSALTIVAFNQRGVVIERRTDTSELGLYFVIDGRLEALGEGVPNWVSATVINHGVAMLVLSQTAASGYELWWNDSFSFASRYTLGPTVAPAAKLIESPGGVAVLLRAGNDAFLQLIGNADSSIPLGIQDHSNVAFVDTRYVWFTARTTQNGVPSFRRARQLQPAD